MSNNSAVPIAAPKTLRYEQDAGLPVAIEARSNRRTFYPSNGEVFAPDGTNVIRMTLNSNSFVDFAHSYLQFKVTNKTLADGDGNALHVAPDFGLPFFNRLQIMSVVAGWDGDNTGAALIPDDCVGEFVVDAVAHVVERVGYRCADQRDQHPLLVRHSTGSLNS